MRFIVKNKSNLKQQEIAKTTRFFLKGYSKKKYYWEFVQLLRKFSLILLTAFLRNNGFFTVFLMIALVTFFFFMHLYHQPYKMKLFNNLESISLMICLITYYFLAYIFRIESREWKTVCFSIILSLNLFFFLLWGKYYLKVIKKNAKRVVNNFSKILKSIEALSPRSNNKKLILIKGNNL